MSAAAGGWRATGPSPRPGEAAALELAGGDGRSARCVLHVVDGLVGAPGRGGVIGEVRFDDADGGAALLAAARDRLREARATWVLGPMDGSTWRAYRVVLPPGEQPLPPGGVPWPAFPGEPANPPDAAAVWRAAGFDAVSEYESAVTLEPGRAADRAWAVPHGIALRPLDLERYDEELALLHRVSLEGFAANRYYAPIDLAGFRALYLPLRPLVDPRFVEIAEDDTGQAVGFLLCYPWPGHAVAGGPVLVAKSIAVAPRARGTGLGGVLFARAHLRARDLGFGAVVHALMQSDNLSTRLSRQWGGQTFRRYVLYGRTP